MLHEISIAWRAVKNNGRTIGLLSFVDWHGVNLEFQGTWCDRTKVYKQYNIMKIVDDSVKFCT